MKKATISNVNWGHVACFACTVCGACPGPTIGTALTGVTLFS